MLAIMRMIECGEIVAGGVFGGGEILTVRIKIKFCLSRFAANVFYTGLLRGGKLCTAMACRDTSLLKDSRAMVARRQFFCFFGRRPRKISIHTCCNS